VAGVFGTDRAREGAYDFLESKHVPPEEIVASVAAATLDRCADTPFVFVPLDGTSITVTDTEAKRDFGNLGSNAKGARGLKVVDALCVDPQGTVVGWLALTFWARDPKQNVPARNTHARRARPVEQKETRYWVDTIRAACSALDERGKRGWFQVDREGDGRDLLMALRDTTHWWTVRGNADRSIEVEGGSDKLRAQMAGKAIVGTYPLAVTARPGRTARTAAMVVRVALVVLRLRDRQTDRITHFPVNVVWAREQATTPANEEPIDWLLFTNRSVDTFADAQLVIHGYAQRWRVEECHRTWKSGECDVEATQLQSFAAVQRWAIVLAAVATRIERLKRLARQTPDSPASLELSPTEVRALTILKFGPAADTTAHPTVAQAVDWLAELGGWTHKYSGRPPGAVVLGRGLRYLRPAAHLLAIQECER
jgi:hypothetical protein